MKLNYEAVGGRRFVLACATLVSATLLAYVGRLDSASYAAVMAAVVAAYVTGNTAQKWIERQGGTK